MCEQRVKGIEPILPCHVLSCSAAALPALRFVLHHIRHLPLSPSRHVCSASCPKVDRGKWRWRGGREGCSDLDTALGWLDRMRVDQRLRWQFEMHERGTSGGGQAGRGRHGRRQTVDGTADLRPGRAVGELSIDHLSVGSCRPPDSLPSQTQIALIPEAENEPLQHQG